MQVVPTSLPCASDPDPSLVIDAVCEMLRRFYAPVLDEGVPEHLAGLVRRSLAKLMWKPPLARAEFKSCSRVIHTQAPNGHRTARAVEAP